MPESIDTSKASPENHRSDRRIDAPSTLEPPTSRADPFINTFGTTVDNTVGLLAAPANALDGGTRALRFSDTRNWLSLMQAVHRSFFSSLQLAIEAGLVAICRERGLQVPSRLRHRMKSAIEKIEKAAE